MTSRTTLWRARRKAGHPPMCPVHWSSAMDDALRELRARGIGFERCGERIGVDKSTVAKRVAALALPRATPARRGSVL